MMDTTLRAYDGRSPRRTFRLVQPAQQMYLAGAILGLTVVFGGLSIANSYAAFGRMFGVALSTAPVPVGSEMSEQTYHFLRVTLTLAVAYGLCALALSMIFVRRLVGPVVALERQIRAIRSGDYGSRVKLRSGQSTYSGMATHLNELAMSLEQASRRATPNSPSLG